MNQIILPNELINEIINEVVHNIKIEIYCGKPSNVMINLIYVCKLFYNKFIEIYITNDVIAYLFSLFGKKYIECIPILQHLVLNKSKNMKIINFHGHQQSGKSTFIYLINDLSILLSNQLINYIILDYDHDMHLPFVSKLNILFVTDDLIKFKDNEKHLYEHFLALKFINRFNISKPKFFFNMSKKNIKAFKK